MKINTIIICFLVSFLAVISFDASAKQTKLYKYFWAKHEGASFYKAIYTIDDKDFDLVIEKNHIFAEGKVLFEKIIAYDADSNILTTYNHVDVKFESFQLKSKTQLPVIEKKGTVKNVPQVKSLQSSSPLVFGFYDPAIFLGFRSFGIKYGSGTGANSMSYSTGAQSVPFGFSFSVLRNSKHSYGMGFMLENYEFKVSDQYKTESKISSSQQNVSLRYAYTPSSSLSLGAHLNVGSLAATSMKYGEIDILDKLVIGYDSFSSTYTGLSVEVSYVGVVLGVDQQFSFSNKSGSSNVLKLGYLGRWFLDGLQFYAGYASEKLKVEFQNSCGAEFTCDDNSSLEIERSYFDVKVGYSF